MNEMIAAARSYREAVMSDPYRPAYHFVIPEGRGFPGDPNGAFYADGVYHLMYLYRNVETEGYHWGHVSSVDLLHWRHHPDALTVEDGDRGCYSGGAFLDDDGTAYLSYWKFPSRDFRTDQGGIAIARSTPPYETWERIYPVAVESKRDDESTYYWKGWGQVDIVHDGFVDHVSCADPSNIWKQDGWYYLQSGNKHVLDVWGRGPDAEPRYRGDWTDLFRSKDLKTWEFVHRFYTNPHENPQWPDETEDSMCPSFLPLYDAEEGGQKTEKMLQLFISHNRGCQYYVGALDGETFHPMLHGRMAWKDPVFFAPEALVDARRRQIMWAWLWTDLEKQQFQELGWCGVYSFPRTLWWEKEQLHMAPVEELSRLQYHHQVLNGSGNLLVHNGRCCRIKAAYDMDLQKKAGLRVLAREDQSAYVEILVDREKNCLTMEAVGCAVPGRPALEEAPFVWEDGETVCLDILVDHSVVEVYANRRQAICRCVFPGHPETDTGVCVVGEARAVEAWELAPTNPF